MIPPLFPPPTPPQPQPIHSHYPRVSGTRSDALFMGVIGLAPEVRELQGFSLASVWMGVVSLCDATGLLAD